MIERALNPLHLVCASLAALVIISCGGSSNTAPPAPVIIMPPPPPPPTTNEPVPDPLFPNSIVSNDLAFIRLTDASTSYCIGLQERARREMPGLASGELFEDDVYIYASEYGDGTSVEIWASASFDDAETAAAEADEIAKRIALLPTFMRETLKHVVLHTGDGGAFAEDLANFFVVYADNMATRRGDNDMEETLFHESVHATMDKMYRDDDPGWKAAQDSDPEFITEYAKERITEDMAESAIFAFADKYSPGRLPEDVTEDMYKIMPARIAFLQDIFPDQLDYFESLRDAGQCP